MRGQTSRESGITLLGFLIVLVVLGFFAFIAMKLVPVYQEYYSVVGAMKGVADEAGAAKFRTVDVQNRMERRFNISYVENLDYKDVKVAKTKTGQKVIWAKYEVRKPLMGNLDFVAKFDKKVPLGNKAGVD